MNNLTSRCRVFFKVILKEKKVALVLMRGVARYSWCARQETLELNRQTPASKVSGHCRRSQLSAVARVLVQLSHPEGTKVNLRAA